MSRLAITAITAATVDSAGFAVFAIMFPAEVRAAGDAIVGPLIWLWLRIPAPPLTLREPKPEPRHRLGHTGELSVVPPATVADPGFERQYLNGLVAEQPGRRYRGRHRHPDEMDDTGMHPIITDDREQVDA